MQGVEKPCAFKELKEVRFGRNVGTQGSMVRDEADEHAGALELILGNWPLP